MEELVKRGLDGIPLIWKQSLDLLLMDGLFVPFYLRLSFILSTIKPSKRPYKHGVGATLG